MAASGAIRVTAGVAAVAITAVMVWIGTGGGSVGDESATEAGSPPQAQRDAATVTTFPLPHPADPVALGETDLDGLTFTDVTEAAGLAAPHAARELTNAEIMSGSAAAADVDDDGDIDLLLTRVGLPNLLYLNDGAGNYADVAVGAGVAGPVPAAGSGTPVFADIDGDADLDLFLTGNPTGGRALYSNNGDGTFADVTSGSGLDLAGSLDGRPQSFGATYADWDHDGDLDLVTLDWFVDPLDGPVAAEAAVGTSGMCERTEAIRSASDSAARPGAATTRSAVLRNDGSGTFTDVSADSGVDLEAIAGFTPLFSDIDGDGWEDLLVTGDLCTSRIYRNDSGGGFVDVTESSNVGDDENAMGSVVEDIDGDGHLDWFVTSIAYPTESGDCPFDGSTVGCSGNRLYLGDGRGSFRDATDEFAVRDGFWGWGAAAADFNNDGHRDLVMTNGYTVGESVAQGEPDPVLARFEQDPSRMWLGRDDLPLPEVSGIVGFDDTAAGKSLIPFDMDADGDLDVLIANTTGPPILYRNDTPPSARWAGLRLRQPGPNPFAVGARVEVFLDNRDAPLPLEVRAGSSFQGSVPTDLHVGLGDAAIDRVVVHWPAGTVPQVITDVESGRLTEVHRSG